MLKSCTALLEKAKKEAEEKTGQLEAKLKQQVQIHCRSLVLGRGREHKWRQ